MAHADKRSVATDALETLGTVIDENQKRDAIHLAVEPVVAGEELFPGERVCLVGGIAFRQARNKHLKVLGIVDPFLEGSVKTYQRFWLVVMPRQITSLRHVWSHPDFAEAETFAEPVKSEYQVMEVGPDLDPDFKEAVRYLRKIADSGYYSSYSNMMLDAMNFITRQSDYFVHDNPTFWQNFKIVSGVDPADRYNDDDDSFACSC